MLLSIIIPAYNADITDIFGLLASIRTQLAVDFNEIEVIIVNDAGEPVPEGMFAYFTPLRIRQINLAANGGPGVARQAGIDAAVGEYIMFCDADDVLHNVGVLSAVLSETVGAEDKPDVLTTKWLEEVRTDEGRMIYTTHMPDWTWMHGKLIRAEFARATGVRHHPELRVHEDSYYLNCLSSHTPKVQESDTISYVWRWHEDSITRRDSGAYTYNSMPMFLHAAGLADAYIEGVNPTSMPERIAYRLCYIYHLTHSDGWIERPEYRRAAEEALVKEIAPYLHYYADCPEDQRRAAYAQTMQHACGAIPDESLSEWLWRLGISCGKIEYAES